MAIEDEAGQVAAQALQQQEQQSAEMLSIAQAQAAIAYRVGFRLQAFASLLANVNDTVMAPDLRNALIEQAGELAWHAELCHGTGCSIGTEAE